MQSPRLAAVVGVCDEIDIIDPCIAHLEGQGVDSIVVVDMMSCDGTRERLRRLRDAGRIALIETENDPYRDAGYLDAGIDLARRRFEPDWIIIQDADEFWLHPSGALAQAVAATDSSALSVDRFNACPCEDLTNMFASGVVDIGACNIFVEPLCLSRDLMDAHPALRWVAGQPAGKIIVRADAVGSVGIGGHSALGLDGRVLVAPCKRDLLIVHVPFLGLARFERKVKRAKSILSTAPDVFPGIAAWHWKRWVEIMDRDRLGDEYMRQMSADRWQDAPTNAIRPAMQYLRQRAGVTDEASRSAKASRTAQTSGCQL